VRLSAARASPVTLRFARPAQTARGTFATRSSVILELCDADGHRGYGEAAPWPGFGTETVEESLATLQRIAPLLLQADVEPANGQEACAPALAIALAAAPAASAALQGALCDLAAQRSGVSLACWLANQVGTHAAAAPSTSAPPPPRSSAPSVVLAQVPVNALLVELASDALRAEAARVRTHGYRAAKLKLGALTLAEDLARVRIARDALGPSIELRGDANGAWSESQARAALAALQPFALAYVEQPVPADAIDALARLRRDAAVPIAVDESVTTTAGLLRVLDAAAADVVVLKPAALRGVRRALELAARARQGGCAVVFTHAFESAIGARHAVHGAAAWGDADAVHGLATDGLFLDDVAAAPRSDRGCVAVSSAPGLGLRDLDLHLNLHLRAEQGA
jgi:o-succinylbenzoate synthase